MLSQAARSFLLPSSIFSGHNSQDQNAQISSSSKTKLKAPKFSWKSKRNKTVEAENLQAASKILASGNHQSDNDGPPKRSTPSQRSESDPTPSLIQGAQSKTPKHRQPPSWSDQQHQKHRRNQSSPSCDLSSGYLSQTNGATSLLKPPAENSNYSSSNNNDTNINESLFYVMQDVQGSNDRHHQCPAQADKSHSRQTAACFGPIYHSHSFGSSTLATRLPMVPMMIDDEEGDEQHELEFEREGENDADEDGQVLATAADHHHDFDFERHHQSYQLMIDGLKRRQQQHRRRQHQQERRFVRHECQEDNKLSLMMLHSAADDSNHHHLNLAADDKCADSESMNSDQQLELQCRLDERDHRYERRQHQHQHHHHHHQHPTSHLAYALAADRSHTGAFGGHNPRLAKHLRYDEPIDDIDDEHQMPAAPVNYHNHSQFDASLRRTYGSASDSVAEPNQHPRQAAVIYYQPDVSNSEHYFKLNNHNRQPILAEQQKLRQQNSCSFPHEQHKEPLAQISKNFISAERINDNRPPQLLKKVAPTPPARDNQQIRGQIHQTGQARSNLATPTANRSKYTQHDDAGQRSIPLNQANTSSHRSQIRTMITKAQTGGSRQHLTSPDLTSIQQQQQQQQYIRRTRSDHQSVAQSGAHHQVTNSANNIGKHQQPHLHARPVPKSSSAIMNGPALSVIAQSTNQMSPSLAAISNGAREADSSAAASMGCCGKLAKFILFIANILFWCAGVALGAWGILALVEDHKYNLSQLLVFEPSSRMSLFQLLAWSFITLGGATTLIGICGCSAMFKNSRWILGLYIFLILAIFALDLATGLLAIIFQERLVANVRLRLVSKLRSEYGIQASFTAAIDYIQTRYECCGLEGHFDYEQSLWRLQRLGGFEATVARTCCHLRNTLDDQAHVNPRPVNESMCQSTDVRFHQSYRFRRGCLDDLERLIRHKIWTFTIGCGIVGAIILMVLALATCFCRSIPDSRQNGNNNKTSSSTTSSSRKTTNRVQQQALMYAENVAKKQGHHHHGHNSHHHMSSSTHHK